MAGSLSEFPWPDGYVWRRCSHRLPLGPPFLLLQNVVESMKPPAKLFEGEEIPIIRLHAFQVYRVLIDMNTIILSVLHDFRICHATTPMDPKLRSWVKPRNTTWFSRFSLTDYDDAQWIQNFRMSKSSLFSVSRILTPHV